MTAVRRNLAVAGVLGAGLALILLLAGTGGAAAQHYDGCFVNGQQVPDSECEGGGGGDGGGYSGGGGCNVICQGIRSLLWGPSGPSAAEIAQRQSNGLNNQGANLYRQGRAAEALQKFQEAIAADPDNIVAQANFYGITGEEDFRSGRLDEALANSQRALEYARRNDPRYGDNSSNYQNIAFNISMIKSAIANRKTQARQQFAAGEQELLDQIRPVHATPVVVNAPPKDDGYVPNPVARLAGDPRDYPDLTSYTKDQHIAHDMNRDGVRSAEIHDWATAMSNFAAAYDYDPTGPFAKVIRQNMETAAKHLDAIRAARAQAAAAAAPGAATPKAKTPPPSAKSAGTSANSQASDTSPKQVLPKTYTQCNAEFQSRTNSCQRADGSWDRAGCFDPAKHWFEGCLKGLTDASFR